MKYRYLIGLLLLGPVPRLWCAATKQKCTPLATPHTHGSMVATAVEKNAVQGSDGGALAWFRQLCVLVAQEHAAVNEESKKSKCAAIWSYLEEGYQMGYFCAAMTDINEIWLHYFARGPRFVTGLPSMSCGARRELTSCLESSDVDGYTPLHRLAYHDNVQLLKELYSIVGADVVQRLMNTPRSVDVVHRRDAKNDPKEILSIHGSPLLVAALLGSLSVSELFFDNDTKCAEPCKATLSTSGDGMTLLHAAAFGGHLTLCRLIRKNMGELFFTMLEKVDASGSTPLDVAAERGHETTVNELYSHSQQSSQRTAAAVVLSAARGGHSTIVYSFLKKLEPDRISFLAHRCLHELLDERTTPLRLNSINVMLTLIQAVPEADRKQLVGKQYGRDGTLLHCAARLAPDADGVVLVKKLKLLLGDEFHECALIKNELGLAARLIALYGGKTLMQNCLNGVTRPRVVPEKQPLCQKSPSGLKHERVVTS